MWKPLVFTLLLVTVINCSSKKEIHRDGFGVYSYDSTFIGDDTITHKRYAVVDKTVEKTTLWIVVAYVVSAITITLITK